MAYNPVFNELLLQWGLNIGTPSRPTAFYISFHTSDPGTTGTGESGALARTAHNAWALGTADDGSVQNSGAGESGNATGSATITHFGVWSASTAGTYYFGGALDVSRAIISGDKLTWADGVLVATIT